MYLLCQTARSLNRHQTVTSVDSSSKQVVFDGGKESISYEILILAMGGTPRRLPIDGSDLANVYTFRGIEDSRCIDTGEIVF